MWDLLYVLLVVFGIIFIVLAIEYEDDPFWNITGALVSAIIWLILALAGMEIEIPYTAYNATSGVIETGYQVYSSPISPYLSYLFLLFFWLCFIYLLAMIWDTWYNYENWHGGH